MDLPSASCCVDGGGSAGETRSIFPPPRHNNNNNALPRECFLAYGCIMLASSAMNNLFVTYYLELFMDLVAVPSDWFYIGQTIFMAWNAVNDPLFGFASDYGFSVRKIARAVASQFWCVPAGKEPPLSSPPKSAKRYRAVQRKRLDIIMYGGIAWTVAFLYVWHPPVFGAVSPSNTQQALKVIHFVSSMCIYDSLLTLVEVNHSALLADLTTSSNERATLNMYSAVCAGVGSMSSFFGHMCWTSAKALPARGDAPYSPLRSFQFCCIAVAICSNICFLYGTSTMRRLTMSGPSYGQMKISPTTSPSGASVPFGASENFSIWIFFKQMLGHKNFWIFQAFYLLQGFDCAFEKNLFSSFLGKLVGTAVSEEVLSTIISLSFILPWVGTLFITPTIKRVGLYRVMQRVLLSRSALLAFSFCFAFASRTSSPKFTCAFLLINRVMSETVCRLCPLVLSDIVDEDFHLQKRTRPISSSIVGASAFMGRISSSMAPMLGYWLLKDSERTSMAWRTLFLLVVSVPAVCVLLQGALWNHYSLHGRYLNTVKKRLMRTLSGESSSV